MVGISKAVFKSVCKVGLSNSENNVITIVKQ